MSCPCGCYDKLGVVRDYKIRRETRVDVGVFFAYLAHRRKARTAFQDGAKLRKLLRRANGENFYAAIAQIAYETGQLEFFGGVLREIAKPHTLHGAGHEVPLGLFRIAHGTRNCNRDAQFSGAAKRVAGALEATGVSELHSERGAEECGPEGPRYELP